MSTRNYLALERPVWWARIGSGDAASFIRLPPLPGHRCLDVRVDVPDGTDAVHIGVGPKDARGVREFVSVERAGTL